MAKAIDLITRAYQLSGLYAAGETLPAEEAQLGLSCLNDMVDSWNTQSLFIPSVIEKVQTVSGVPITIGPGQTIDVTRPTEMQEGAFVRINGVDFPIQWITRPEYESIIVKATPSPIPCYGYYDSGVTVGNIYLWPYPAQPVELHLPLQTQLSAFADLVTDYQLIQGYKKALEYSLAEEVAAGIVELSPKVVRMAINARRAIRRTNAEVPVMSIKPDGIAPYASFIAGL